MIGWPGKSTQKEDEGGNFVDSWRMNRPGRGDVKGQNLEIRICPAHLKNIDEVSGTILE